LLIVITLCLLSALLVLVRRERVRDHVKFAVEFSAIIALSIGSQVAVETLLYGTPSLNGNRPPFLTARLIADGPGQWYLEKSCGGSQWEMCHYLGYLTDNSDQFLWDPEGVWSRANADSRKRLLSQERSFTLAVLQAYPLEEFEKAMQNARRQLMAFGVTDLRRYDTVVDHIGEVLPRERSKYLASPQAQQRLPGRLFTRIQYGIVTLSLLGMLVFLPRLRRSPNPKLVGLGFVILSAVVVNAIVTGTLSTVNDRYQSRVIWLVPFLAGLCVLVWEAGDQRGAIPHRIEPTSELV
jgi:hypothetical protein